MRSIDGRDDGKVEWDESRGCDASAAFVIRVKPASQPALGLKSGLLMDNFWPLFFILESRISAGKSHVYKMK